MVANRVLVLSSTRKPLMPCHPARARELLKRGRAGVFRRFPFTIILRDREDGEVQPTQLKVDPGSQTSGVALVAEGDKGKRVVWAAQIEHRGKHIRGKLLDRRQQRRGRRTRKLRYRQPRFQNRTRPAGWLPPSLMSRVDNLTTWANRLWLLTPIMSVSLEMARFDTQQMQNAEIAGIEYQQGTLFGYEVREYLLEKWSRQCVYCGIRQVPLQVEHIVPKVRGGSDRISNLTLACEKCNQLKGSLTATEFGFPRIQAQAKLPLKDAAAVNATRWRLYELFVASRVPLEVGSGGRTKYNRCGQAYPKAHWIDAACVGPSGECVYLDPGLDYLTIAAVGHGSRQMCRVNRYGFPRTTAKRQKVVKGFKTGDMVRASVPASSRKAGRYMGKVAVRSSGSFDLRTASGTIQGVSFKYCQLIHQSDGYNYV